jgi:hypothetical protein
MQRTQVERRLALAAALKIWMCISRRFVDSGSRAAMSEFEHFISHYDVSAYMMEFYGSGQRHAFTTCWSPRISPVHTHGV